MVSVIGLEPVTHFRLHNGDHAQPRLNAPMRELHPRRAAPTSGFCTSLGFCNGGFRQDCFLYGVYTGSCYSSEYTCQGAVPEGTTTTYTCAVKADEFPCSTDVQCASGLCFGGVCTQRQANGADCGGRDDVCTSGYCNLSTGLCDIDTRPVPSSLPPRLKARRSRLAAMNRSLCPGNTTACPLSDRPDSGTECVSLDEELAHCGACGNNCEALAKPGHVAVCEEAQCKFY